MRHTRVAGSLMFILISEEVASIMGGTVEGKIYTLNDCMRVVGIYGGSVIDM